MVTQSFLTLCDPMTVALQGPLSMEFSRPESCSGLPFSPPEIFPTHGSNPHLPCLSVLQADSLLLSHQGSPYQIPNLQVFSFSHSMGYPLHFLTESFLVSFETQKNLILMQPHFTCLLFNCFVFSRSYLRNHCLT